MKNFFSSAGLMVLLLVAVGCSRKTVPSVITEVTDSTYVKEIPRNVAVTAPADSTENTLNVGTAGNISWPVEEDLWYQEETTKSGRATLKMKSEKGKVTAKCYCDSLSKTVQVMDKEIFRLKHEKKQETIVQTEYKTRRIDIACRWISGIVVGLLLGYAAVKYFKPSLPWT